MKVTRVLRFIDRKKEQQENSRKSLIHHTLNEFATVFTPAGDGT